MKLRKQNKNKRNLLRIVNKDRDWDYSFIYILLRQKLSNIVDYVERGDSVSETKEWRLQWLKRCVSLLDILISERVDNNVYVNTKNAKRFHEAKFLTFDNLTFDNVTVTNETFLDIIKITSEELKRYNEEEFYLIKAKHLLFNIMSNYIQYWWD